MSHQCQNGCSGSFKFRGALNALANLDAKQAEKGVVVHSSGNHAGAVALAAKIFEIPAYIVLPTDAPQVHKPQKVLMACCKQHDPIPASMEEEVAGGKHYSAAPQWAASL